MFFRNLRSNIFRIGNKFAIIQIFDISAFGTKDGLCILFYYFDVFVKVFFRQYFMLQVVYELHEFFTSILQTLQVVLVSGWAN